jgi:hypothetical protein
MVIVEIIADANKLFIAFQQWPTAQVHLPIVQAYCLWVCGHKIDQNTIKIRQNLVKKAIDFRLYNLLLNTIIVNLMQIFQYSTQNYSELHYKLC